MDRDKVIKAIDICLGHGKCEDCPYCLSGAGYTTINCRDYMLRGALALLKEQEEKPLRCKTCTMRDKTGFCHRWNIEVKDDDYCSFGAWKGC